MTCASQKAAIDNENLSASGLSLLIYVHSLPALPHCWRQRVQERHHLRGLSDHVLGDMGLTRADVVQEAAKPFWKPLVLHRYFSKSGSRHV